jgi:hypothetical protein
MGRELNWEDKKQVKQQKPETDAPQKQPSPTDTAAAVLKLQKQAGNRAVQRLIAQRKGGEGFGLDDDTAGRINQARGGGQSLDGSVQTQMGQAMGHDFSGVRVHNSSESDSLNQELGARAFTTGQDVFFKQGEYNPGSSGGRELIAHELTHVVQQSAGRVPGGEGGMTVRPANDAFEQEADAVAQQAMSAENTPASQGEAGIQRQEDEDELQMKSVQRQEDEEELQMKSVQRQEEEEEIQTMSVQRQEDEEELQMKSVQRQEEEEELQMKRDH